MEAADFLTLAAAGAIITTVGSLFALFIKEFILIRYFEERKERKSLDAVYKKYKDPITLASMEFSSRLLEIHKDFPATYLSESAMTPTEKTLSANSADDPHYKKYKLISTVYRLCSFFGWLELYRQDITFLNSSNDSANKKIENSLSGIRLAFSEGRMNPHPDWIEWKDYLIFKEEQRAIGECMIIMNDKTRTIMGFAKFQVLAEEFITSGSNQWLAPAFNFFLNPRNYKDFRITRYYVLINYFKELLETMDREYTTEMVEKLNDYVRKIPESTTARQG